MASGRVRLRVVHPQDWMSEKSVRGGPSASLSEPPDGVMALPSSISPTRIMTEYAPVVDRTSQVSG
jgi:hypothetical protein